MRSRSLLIGAALGVASSVSSLNADIVGICHQGRWVEAVDGFGGPDFNGFVIDIWLQSNDPDDNLRTIFNLNIDNTIGWCYYQSSLYGGTWLPNNSGSGVETEALRHADSFVSIGGRNSTGEPSYENGLVVQMDPNGTGLDPNFGSPTVCVPSKNAGWYNNPSAYIGRPVDGKIFVGRFAINGVEHGQFDIYGDVEACWDQGAGTPSQCGYFVLNSLDPHYCMIDCNGNMIEDSSDIASGTSLDCNLNGVPDECETGDPHSDCNGNGNPDWCDIADGKADINKNGIPDSCDLARGDLDLDGCVGGDDLGLLLAIWGPCPDGCIEDINDDGIVSGGDLGILLANWNLCP